MFGSAAGMSNDLNFPFPAAASSSKRGKDEAAAAAAAADIHLHHQQHHPHGHGHGHPHPHHHAAAEQHQQQQQQQQQMTSGLLRYRSAPGNLLGEVCEEFLPHRAGNPEGEPMFARFIVPELRDHFGAGGGEKQGESSGAAAAAPTAEPPPGSHHGGVGFPTFTQLLFQSTSQPLHHPPLTGINAAAAAAAATASSDDPYRVVTSTGGDQDLANKSGGGGGGGGGDSSSLLRQSSSPAFFSHLSSENGFNPNRLKSQISFSSRHGSAASGLMSQISESRSENLGSGGSGSPEESRNGRCFIPGYPVASWEDSVLMNDNFAAGAKRSRGDSSENGDTRTLVHHMSFPKSSQETEYLQFQDGVPWKLRAKRGCATHPRSIAERVRRTKISERMRKLQELVPNMEKQTNTADMLELAVDYIKTLQDQVKTLNDRRANCTCSSK